MAGNQEESTQVSAAERGWHRQTTGANGNSRMRRLGRDLRDAIRGTSVDYTQGGLAARFCFFRCQ